MYLPNNVSPTARQIKTVNAVISGENNLSAAMQQAGYSFKTSENPKQNFVDSRGVQVYLQTLDEKSRKKFNMSIVDKALEVYLEALDANKFVPVKMTMEGSRVSYKVAKEVDHDTRMKAADRIVKLQGLDHELPKKASEEHNVPAFNSPEVINFNRKFQAFLEQNNT